MMFLFWKPTFPIKQGLWHRNTSSPKPFGLLFSFTVLFGFFSLCHVNALAKEFVAEAATYDVKENDPVEDIQRKLHHMQGRGDLDLHQKKILNKTKERILNPMPVKGIRETMEERVYTYDPTFVAKRDYKDHFGRTFFKKGQKINPLELLSFNKPFLFIDGTNPSHIKWALLQRKKHPTAKIILLNGSPLKLQKKMRMPFYFDQFGRLIKKFGIRQIPAIVTEHFHYKEGIPQKTGRLLVKECFPRGMH